MGFTWNKFLGSFLALVLSAGSGADLRDLTWLFFRRMFWAYERRTNLSSSEAAPLREVRASALFVLSASFLPGKFKIYKFCYRNLSKAELDWRGDFKHGKNGF